LDRRLSGCPQLAPTPLIVGYHPKGRDEHGDILNTEAETEKLFAGPCRGQIVWNVVLPPPR
jgi:hypothetical protein